MLHAVIVLLQISLCDARIGIVQVGKNFQSSYILVNDVLVAKVTDVGFFDCRNHNCLQFTFYLLVYLEFVNFFLMLSSGFSDLNSCGVIQYGMVLTWVDWIR